MGNELATSMKWIRRFDSLRRLNGCDGSTPIRHVTASSTGRHDVSPFPAYTFTKTDRMAEFAALGAALCWAIAGLVAADASRAMGGIAFTRIRMVFVMVMLGAWLSFAGFSPIRGIDVPALLVSGLLGIFIGDTALFVTLARLGPRRTAILFSANAPFTVLLAWLLLGETLALAPLIGCVLVACGVLVAIVYGKRREQRHVWESVQGSLGVGITIGLLAALGQSLGSLLAAPALENGTDAATVAAVRIGIALLALYVFRWVSPSRTRSLTPLTPALAGRLALSGLLGMAVGMTLLLYAFKQGSVGLSAALSSTTPIMLIPLIWWRSGERPAAGACLGAVLAVVGSALIVMR